MSPFQRFRYTLSALALGASPLLAQNLVPNPGFEENHRCPGSYTRNNERMVSVAWYSANAGSPDGFHACSTGEAGVPYNWAGVSDAYEGTGYGGIYLWMSLLPYREYLQCELTKPLAADSSYRVSFRYKLSSYSKYSVDRIGVHLGDSALVSQRSKGPLGCAPTFAAVADSAITPETGNWEMLHFLYKAGGGERFLTIGNFGTDHETRFYQILHRPVQEEMLGNGAYYYIDDVIVEPLYPEVPLPRPPVFGGGEVVAGKAYVLDDVHFDFDSYRLQRRSFAQLDELADFLHRNPSYRVRLSGHTDDLGSARYNRELSLRRAATVELYLVSAGIDRRRVETEGLGKSKPLIEGDSEAVRRLNRRVEVRFLD